MEVLSREPLPPVTDNETSHNGNRRARGLSAPLLVAFIAIGSIIARRPDAVTNPQFWAEDGALFFHDAYTQPWLRPFLTPHTGYLQTVSRLGALVAQAVPLARAPLVLNLLAIGLQALPAVLFATRRFDHLVPDWRVRGLIIAVYLALPNAAEVQANLTNAQWHLALVLPLLAFARPPASWAGRFIDVTLLLLAGLSGPFSILFAPFLLFYWWRRGRERGSWLTVVVGVTLLTAGVQLWESLSTAASAQTGERFPGLPTNVPLLARVVGSQVLGGLLIGRNGYNAVLKSQAWQSGWVVYPLVGIGAALVLAAAIRGPLELGMLLGYGGAILAAGITFPIGGSAKALLPTMLTPGAGQRYYVIPMLALAIAVIWLLTRKPVALRMLAAVTLAVVALFGVRLDWRYPSYPDLHYEQVAQHCLAEPAGTACVVPTPPGWTFAIPSPG